MLKKESDGFATEHDSNNFLQITKKNRRFKQSHSPTKLTFAEQHNEVANVFFLRDDSHLLTCSFSLSTGIMFTTNFWKPGRVKILESFNCSLTNSLILFVYSHHVQRTFQSGTRTIIVFASLNCQTQIREASWYD